MNLPQFRARVEQAFAEVPYPEDDQLTGCDCWECSDLDAYFRGKSWRGHTVQNLRFNYVALCMFQVPALHYYLPAFVLAQLEDPATADVISDCLVSVFRPSPFQPTKAETLAQALSPAQRALMIEYFEYCLDVEGDDFDDSLAQALANLHAADIV